MFAAVWLVLCCLLLLLSCVSLLGLGRLTDEATFVLLLLVLCLLFVVVVIVFAVLIVVVGPAFISETSFAC